MKRRHNGGWKVDAEYRVEVTRRRQNGARALKRDHVTLFLAKPKQKRDATYNTFAKRLHSFRGY